MSLVAGAFEIEGLLLTSESGKQIGLFVGDGPPNETIPTAPENSIYLRTDGQVYGNKRVVTQGESSEDWPLDPLAGPMVSGCVPVVNAAGDLNHMATELNILPLAKANGDTVGVTLEVCP